MPLSDNFLQELKYKIDIEDVVSTYVSLKRRGTTLVGLCPFHNEKTPSFTVYPSTQSFYCFGCGAGGDPVTFVKRIENLDYIDAVKMLAQRAGIDMPQDGFDDSLSKKRRKVLQMNREAAKFYHSQLMSDNGKVGLDYFLSRGLTPKTINHFGLGYAPNEWDSLIKHMNSLGYSGIELVEASLARQGKNGGYYDNFRNRVITPIIDVRGNVIAFGGRVLDDSKPKYLNSNDTLVYKKTNELFALNYAKDSKEESLILCEGYMDAIAMHQAGFTNAVAGCGTALTEEQVRLISRYSSEVYLAYDADEAGQKALHKAMTLFKKTEVKVKVPSLIGGKDPDEIIKTYGRDKFKGILEGASNEMDFKILELKNKNNILTTQGKIDFVNDAIKILAQATPVEQDLYMSRISEELSIDKQSIKIQLDEYVSKYKRKVKRNEYKNIISSSIRDANKTVLQTNESIKKIKAEERIIGLLLYHPNYKSKLDGFNKDILTTGFTQKVFSLIMSKLENNEGIDLIDFSSSLTNGEMDKLSGIVAKYGDSDDAEKEICDCLETIKTEYENKNSSSPNTLSDDDFRNLFKRNT